MRSMTLCRRDDTPFCKSKRTLYLLYLRMVHCSWERGLCPLLAVERAQHALGDEPAHVEADVRVMTRTQGSQESVVAHSMKKPAGIHCLRDAGTHLIMSTRRLGLIARTDVASGTSSAVST